MNFTFYKNETEEVIKLINDSFDIENKNKKLDLQNNQRILLLKDNNIVIGLSLITLKVDPIKNKKTFYLDYFCIAKEYRNKHFGTFLFEKIEKIAKEEKIDYIELTSNKNRVNARKLYEKNGMEVIDTDIFRKRVIN